MIVPPVIVSVIWIAVARERQSRRQTPLAPATTMGRIALASLALVIVVALTDAALAATLPRVL